MDKEEFLNIEIDFKNPVFQFEKLNSFFSNKIFIVIRYLLILPVLKNKTSALSVFLYDFCKKRH